MVKAREVSGLIIKTQRNKSVEKPVQKRFSGREMLLRKSQD